MSAESGDWDGSGSRHWEVCDLIDRPTVLQCIERCELGLSLSVAGEETK